MLAFVVALVYSNRFIASASRSSKNRLYRIHICEIETAECDASHSRIRPGRIDQGTARNWAPGYGALHGSTILNSSCLRVSPYLPHHLGFASNRPMQSEWTSNAAY
jgi:hypothetical protein